MRSRGTNKGKQNPFVGDWAAGEGHTVLAVLSMRKTERGLEQNSQ